MIRDFIHAIEIFYSDIQLHNAIAIVLTRLDVQHIVIGHLVYELNIVLWILELVKGCQCIHL